MTYIFNFPQSNYRDLAVESNSNTASISIYEHFKCEAPLETFIVYTSAVKINEKMRIIKRRFSDFDWLMEYLNIKYPFHILPPMPPKRMVPGLHKFDRNFLDQRMKALEVMMNRLFQFSDCLNDSRVKFFLQMEDVKEFIQYRDQNKNNTLFDQFQAMVKEIIKSSIENINSSYTVLSQDESSIICLQILSNRMTDKIVLTAIIDHINLLRKNWLKFSTACLSTAQQLADIVLLTDESHTSQLLDYSAQFCFNWASDAREIFSGTYGQLLPVFIEYQLYDEKIVKKLRRRNKAKNALVIKNRQSTVMKSNLTPNETDSLPKGSKLDQLTIESITLENTLSEFDSVFYPSYQKWHELRCKDFHSAFNSYVNYQKSYNIAVLEMSKNCLEKIYQL